MYGPVPLTLTNATDVATVPLQPLLLHAVIHPSHMLYIELQLRVASDMEPARLSAAQIRDRSTNYKLLTLIVL